MPEITDPQERDWLSKLEAANAFSEGPEGQNYALRSWKSWDTYVQNVGLLSYPEGIGDNSELKDYVLFDFYDTAGQAISKEATKKPKESVGSSWWDTALSWGSFGTYDNRTEDEKIEDDLIGEIEDKLSAAGGDVDSAAYVKAIGDAAEDVINLVNPNVDPQALAAANAGFGIRSYNSTKLGFGSNLSRIGLSIALPMPAKIDSNYSFEYEDTDFTGLANVISAKEGLKEAGDGENVSDETKEIIRKMVSIPGSVVDDISKIFGEGEVNLNAALDLKKRQAPNQFKEQVFKNVGRRSFSFEYKFNPKSEKEAINIYAILYAFKRYSHPKRTKGGLYLDYPGQFKIGFYDKLLLNDFLFRIGLCACTKCDISYGSDKDLSFFRSIFEDKGVFNNGQFMYGSPANQVTMKLEFTELELLTRERIQQGY